MATEVFTRDGIEIRRLKSGRCVREEEWKQSVKLNEVRSFALFGGGSDTGLTFIYIMLKNEPFEELPLSFKPVPQRGHCPPTLSFGFAIPKTLIRFRQAALENNLGDPEEVSTTEDFFMLQTLVMSHLNERCGLPPEEGITCGYIQSTQGALVLELTTNYEWRIPKEKLDDAIRGIKEVFQLPDDAKPKWYLEGDIDLKEPDEYLFPSKLPFFTTVIVAKDLTFLIH